ncbi:shikimate kinase [Candidatus Chloroploca asiatica]|uniref:Shikimate kinase n=1 Tax=Candidatus Chloroploca asiatica TaxID=1506545 RepID=A0A2H3L3D6_9CHLR|nr:shikimate kinase [Candidatus Chloroploca asiatica]PDV96740.1 hypothetical protein A9Q02_05810 [Candidatus Chloroploca asiatica]
MTQGSPECPLVLVGLSGAGKSTVGPVLAARLGRPLCDTDVLVAHAAGMPVPTIFATHGEATFREREAEALAEALAGELAVVATGGGIVLRPANRQLLREHAFVVWLDAPDRLLLARLRTDAEERPLLGDEAATRLAAMRAARGPLYAEVAHVTVETSGLTPETITDQIVAAYTDALVRGRRS